MIGDGRYINAKDSPFDTGITETSSTGGPPMLYDEDGTFRGYRDNIGR